MSSFINFNNKEITTGANYSAEVIKIALLKSETKSSPKAEMLVKNVKEPVSLNEALVFFTDKLSAMKSLSNAIIEVNEGRVKQFEMDYASMVKDIKKGYGWIDPEYVADTWENSSDSIGFDLVRDEIFDRLIAAGLLAHADSNNPEKAGKYIKSAKDLYVMESEEVNETEKIEVGTFVRYKKDKDFTGGKILSIKGSNVEIHNWDGSTTELPLKDLEYVKSWNESVVTEAKFDKKKLMKAVTGDDGIISTGDGKEYIIYKYGNGNDDNDAMWNDKSIFALDQDGEEHEIEYSDIVRYDESIKPSWDNLLEEFEMVEITNEDLRTEIKKFIKKNNEELDEFADNDNWDAMYQKLYDEFGVEADSAKGKDLLKTFQFIY